MVVVIVVVYVTIYLQLFFRKNSSQNPQSPHRDPQSNWSLTSRFGEGSFRQSGSGQQISRQRSGRRGRRPGIALRTCHSVIWCCVRLYTPRWKEWNCHLSEGNSLQGKDLKSIGTDRETTQPRWFHTLYVVKASLQNRVWIVNVTIYLQLFFRKKFQPESLESSQRISK